MKVLLTGGGTGGHILPNIALIQDLRRYFDEIVYVGSCGGLEEEIVKKQANVDFYGIKCVKFQRKFCFANLKIPFLLTKSIFDAKKLLKKLQPNVVFSKGGYVALPIAIASSMLKIPLITHESDLTMGLANKIISKKAKIVCTAFEKTAQKLKNGVFTGMPIRRELLHGNRQKGLKSCGFDEKLPILLVIGGSSGAKSLNDEVRNNLKVLTKKYQIIHICGKNNLIGENNLNLYGGTNLNLDAAKNLDSKSNVIFVGETGVKKDFLKVKNYFQVEFCDKIEDIFACSDFVISRAGSTAINEFLVLKKPMMLIPLSNKASRGDQVENAKYFADLGACVQCDKLDIKLLDYAFANREKLIENINKIKIVDANSKISRLLYQNAKKP